MRMDIGRKPFGDGDVLHDASYAARCKRAASPVDEQFCCSRARFGQHLAARLKIGPNRFRSSACERNIALLLAFTANQQHLVGPLEIVQLNSNQLRVAQAAAIKKLKNGAVTLRKRRGFGQVAIEYAIHFFKRWNTRQFFGNLGRRDKFCGILPNDSFASQPAIHGAQRSQRPRY